MYAQMYSNSWKLINIQLFSSEVLCMPKISIVVVKNSLKVESTLQVLVESFPQVKFIKETSTTSCGWEIFALGSPLAPEVEEMRYIGQKESFS